MSIKSIICGVTGSENSEKAVRVALEMAAGHAARLTFVYIVDVRFLTGLTIQLRPKYAEDFLERVGNRVLDEALEVSSAKGVIAKKVLRKGHAMTEMRKAIEEEAADLLVVGDEGRSFAKKVLFGTRVPDNVKELKKRMGISVKVIH